MLIKGFDEQYAEDEHRATGASEVKEDFISNLSRISQLTGTFLARNICGVHPYFSEQDSLI
jgi:hypothetical protein